MNGTITAFSGDVIPLANIDAIGKVNETISFEPVYKKIFKWQILWSVKEIVIGYEYMIHTAGGCYYRINHDTKEQAENDRKTLVDAINGFMTVRIS